MLLVMLQEKKAVECGMDIADQFGLCSVAVKNSSHAGAIGATCLRAARKGYMIFGFTNADSLSLSYGGTKPFWYQSYLLCFSRNGRSLFV